MNSRKTFTRDYFTVASPDRSDLIPVLRWAHQLGMEGGLDMGEVTDKQGRPMNVHLLSFLIPFRWSDSDVDAFRQGVRAEMEKPCQ
jgi:hypothetical protein